MEKIYTDPNMENDNTEHIRGKRLSSILKAPRNPLDDLGNGNELTQEVNIEKRRKSSRRVSFANTINCRVFQRDLKNSTTEVENTECAADKGDVFPNQNEGPEAVSCEITGMNTLLHAPIQAVVQQNDEWQEAEQAAGRAGRQDTTLLFPEEGDMEMTASHTALISRDLQSHQAEQGKIDITSFLAGLKADTSRDPTNHPGSTLDQKEEAPAVKKINFSEFLLSLKSGDNTPSPAEGPDEENVFFVPSRGSEDVAQPSGEFPEPPDTCDVTRVFRGQEGGMEMTLCEAAQVKVPFPGQLERGDVTQAFADDGMDMTTSHTAKVSLPLPAVGSQSLPSQNNSLCTESDNPVVKRASTESVTVQLCADRKVASAGDRGAPAVLRAVRQEARTVPAIWGSVSSQTVFRGDQTGMSPKCEDMEMTGNYTDIIYNDHATERDSSCPKTCEKPVSADPLVAGNRPPARGDGDIPRAVAAGVNGGAASRATSALELPPASDGHMGNVSQAPGAAAADAGLGSCVNSGAPRDRVRPSAHPQLVPSGESTVIFPGEDMDLTRACVKEDGKGVDSESPSAVLTFATCSPYFRDSRSTASQGTEQEEMEMTKCHAVTIDGQSAGTTAEGKQVPCKSILRKSQSKNVTGVACPIDMDKENIEVLSIDGNSERSQAVEVSTKHPQMMVDKNLEKSTFQASDPSACLLPEQNRGIPGNVVTDTKAPLSLQRPLEKSLPDPPISCTKDRTIVCSGDQRMDITKVHSAAFDVASLHTGQESNSDNQNNATSRDLQSQPCLFSGHPGVDITNPTAAVECGDMDTNEPVVTPLAPRGSFILSNNPAPDYTVQAVLSQAGAAPGYPGQGGDQRMPFRKGAAMTIDHQEQPLDPVNSSVSGRKRLPLGSLKDFAGESTILFLEDADMDITRSHTVSADRVIFQSKASNDATALTSRDQTCVSPCSMEITKLDEPMGKTASQGVLSTARRDRRKSLKGMPGEKTVLFSLGSQDDDMEMTQSHVAAIGHKILVQDEGGLQSLPSAHPGQGVTFTGSQVDTDISKSLSADKTRGEVACGVTPGWGEEAGVPHSPMATFAEDDMEMTKPLHVTLAGDPLQGQQPVPSTSTLLFSSHQGAMEVTECHSGCGGDGCFPGDRTVSFPSAEDVEITRTHRAEARPPPPATPADRTIVFAPSLDDMEITASHTVAFNNRVNEFGALPSPQQPPQHTHGVLVSSRGELDTRDLDSQCPTKPRDQPRIPSSALSTSEFPREKGAREAPSGTTAGSIYSASLPEKTVDLQTPQESDLPRDNSVPVSKEQDLTAPENPQSKGAPFKLPGNGPVDCREVSGDLGSHLALPLQGSDPLEGSPDAHTTWRSKAVTEGSALLGDASPDSGLAGASLVPAANKEPKENEELSVGEETPPKDFQINSDQTEQPRDQECPTVIPELSGILNVCSKLRDLRRKSAAIPVSQTAFPDQLPKSSAETEDTSRLAKPTGSEANNLLDTREQEDTGLEGGAAPTGTAPKDKYPGVNIPLGIFQPKLPNRRTPSVSSVQDTNTKPDRAEAPAPVNPEETPGNKSSRQNFSPSQFIAEEFLPVCLEEMDSNGSVSSELVEKVCGETSNKQIPHEEEDPLEEAKTCNAKRALERDEEDFQGPKKVKRDVEAQDLQVSFGAVPENPVEGAGAGEPAHLSAESPDCLQASTSSSLAAGKADMELTIQPSSQVESQLLTDSICENTLWEKFQFGTITVGEFFTLLQVHVVIQKPRHSHLPANCAASAAPAPEDLIYSQYIHRPKLQVYEEDCKALAQKIDELKPYANVQDQLLVSVNRSLWEVMRTCSDEELKNFGAELNKMKSYFTKESKILGHNEKENLYSKLLQSAQEQHGKLQARMEKVDELLKEAEDCLVALESDSFWDEEGEAEGGQSLQKELESLRAQEEELQRELSEMETEDQQMLLEMDELRETEKICREVLEKYDFTEWEITEWSEQKAIFSFLYDSLELTVVFGPPVDGDDFGGDPSRTVLNLNFESFLDEEQAPPSSCLVQRLIFQFIDSQGSWQEKCPTLHYLPQVLHDISLVVNRCKTLGEEMEFLESWGVKFNLMKTDIQGTEVKLLFSSFVAFAKFELTLHLSPNYPFAALPFSVHTLIGNIGEKEISAVLSSVPPGHHYLRRMVSSVHQNLLQDPR